MDVDIPRLPQNVNLPINQEISIFLPERGRISP